MKLIKSIWNKIKEPKGVFLILFYIFFAIVLAGTITLVVLKQGQSVFHFLLYVLSAICLAYCVYSIVILAPKMKQNIIKEMQKHKFTNTMLESYGYRTMIFGIFSFLLNMAYVIFMGILAFMTKSAWYISITFYYLVLSLMKGRVLYSKKKYNSIERSAKAYRYCGIMFIIMTVAFSGIMVLIYTSNMYFEYAGLMIYAVAAYTFFKLGMAIYNIFKARSHDDLYVQSIRNINLASALVSIVVLQVALFQAFSPISNSGVSNGITGGAISLLILLLGIFMIIKANKSPKKKEI